MALKALNLQDTPKPTNVSPQVPNTIGESPRGICSVPNLNPAKSSRSPLLNLPIHGKMAKLDSTKIMLMALNKHSLLSLPEMVSLRQTWHQVALGTSSQPALLKASSITSNHTKHTVNTYAYGV